MPAQGLVDQSFDAFVEGIGFAFVEILFFFFVIVVRIRVLRGIVPRQFLSPISILMNHPHFIGLSLSPSQNKSVTDPPTQRFPRLNCRSRQFYLDGSI